MGILHDIKRCKCPQTLKELNQYIKFSVRFAETETFIEFHRQCVEKCTYPKAFSKALRRHHIRPTRSSLKRHALNIIESAKSKLSETERHIAQRKAALDDLNHDERVRFIEYVRNVTSKRTSKRRVLLQKTLTVKECPNTFPSNPERYVHNLSSIRLDTLQMQALSLGLKFCHPRNNDHRLEIETQFEYLNSQTSDLAATSNTNLEQFKSDLVNISFQYQRYPMTHSRLLTKAHIEAIRELQKNESIIITKPDKGSGAVIMDRTEYVQKMKLILSDSSKFVRCEREKDKTDYTETQLTKCLKSLVTDGHITKERYERIRPTGSIIPRLYGLPKIHKPGAPLRPILDMRNSPYHTIAKWLTSILDPIKKRIAPHQLTDTFQFMENVKNMNILGYRMFSLDVVSLFTNVPLIETVNFLCTYIEKHKIKIEIPTVQLKQLLLRCTYNI
ncbi:unnamed protein product [Dicrocoelium dendriticum]|nr:unnamed protein product [Dicrocoelium dendriticum]